ncbi:MAG: hypothetical protein GC147_06345 [Porphyrobacter sp.]|nr:hypothetical protein [Porphyrobacter sp.]
MLESDPFSPLVYWPHVVLGITSVFFAAIAIAVRKGSARHRQAGWAFSAAMSVAAVTAIAFSFVRFAPPALFSSSVVLYGVGAGVLSLRRREGSLRLLQRALSFVPILIALAALAAAAALALVPPPPEVEVPLPLLIAGPLLFLAVAALFAALARGDFRFLREQTPGKPRRYRRHALRMALAVTEVVRAPLISFGPPLGEDGILSFPVYFFGPFFLIPLIYFLAMPAWLKSGEAGGEPQLSGLAAE